jgi:hypothetical protein
MPPFQILLDENMDRKVLMILRSWITVGQIGHEVGRPGMQDEEIIPGLLLQLKRTTLLTQDERIYNRERPHAAYCLVIVPELSPLEIADLVRRLLKLPGFRTVKERMGKVVRLTTRLNVALAIEVSRYIREHADVARQIPRGAQLVIQREGDEEFNQWSRKVAEKQREEGQPVVYVIIRQMEPVRSRIADARIEQAVA